MFFTEQVVTVWNELKLPYIFERMIEFSVPEDDTVLIVAYDGAHLLKLEPQVSCVDYPEHAEGDDLNTDNFAGRRFQMLGSDGGEPILFDAEGHWLEFDLTAEELMVLGPSGEEVQTIKFDDLSGDWGYATFSRDGKWILIGVPYDLYVYRRESVKPSTPTTSAPSS